MRLVQHADVALRLVVVTRLFVANRRADFWTTASFNPGRMRCLHHAEFWNCFAVIALFIPRVKSIFHLHGRKVTTRRDGLSGETLSMPARPPAQGARAGNLCARRLFHRLGHRESAAHPLTHNQREEDSGRARRGCVRLPTIVKDIQQRHEFSGRLLVACLAGMFVP